MNNILTGMLDSSNDRPTQSGVANSRKGCFPHDLWPAGSKARGDGATCANKTMRVGFLLGWLRAGQVTDRLIEK